MVALIDIHRPILAISLLLTGAVELKGVLGNINAQYANSSHVGFPSKFKALQTESSL